MNNNPNGGRFMELPLGNMSNSPHDIRTYWTPERMQAAIPTNMGTMPEVGAVPDAANEEPATEPAIADMGKMPFAAGGKLFFTMNGVDFVASANIFMRNDMLLTAAHCIQDKVTGNLAENFAFQRCYTGELSAEVLTFKTVALKENWYLTKEPKWDYAIVVLNEHSTVETPLKYSIDLNIEGKKATSLGYPVSYFDGEQMMFSNGTLTSKDGNWVMMGCKMSGGSSGGAWVLEDGITAIGLNAFIATTGKEILYSASPKFDEEFEKLYQYALTLI